MSDEPDRPDSRLSSTVAACVLLVLGTLPLGTLAIWAYRMVAVGGSVPIAWQMAISLGWSAIGFVATMLIVSVCLLFLAASLLNRRPGQH